MRDIRLAALIFAEACFNGFGVKLIEFINDKPNGITV